MYIDIIYALMSINAFIIWLKYLNTPQLHIKKCLYYHGLLLDMEPNSLKNIFTVSHLDTIERLKHALNWAWYNGSSIKQQLQFHRATLSVDL